MLLFAGWTIVHSHVYSHVKSLHITSESAIFENVAYSGVVVKGRLRKNIDFWRSIGASNWLLKVICEGYCLPFVDLPPKKCFFCNHDSTLCNLQFVSSEISMLLMSGALAEVNAADLLVCNPLGVATNSSGKHRLIVDLCFCESASQIMQFQI